MKRCDFSTTVKYETRDMINKISGYFGITKGRVIDDSLKFYYDYILNLAMDKVMTWISDNYNIGSIIVNDFPEYAGGKILIDEQKKSYLIYYDYSSDSVVCKLTEKVQ